MSAEPGGMPSGEGRLPGVGGPADHHPYDEYVTPLFDYCQELLGSPAAAADAVRETLISAEAQVGNVREPGLLPVWLYYLARQQCQELRPEGLPEMAVPMAVLATLGSTADADATDTAEISRNGIEKYGRRMEALIAATTALAWLPPRDREVLSLAFRHGLDAEDLAAVLGIAGFRAQVLLSAAAGRFDKAAAVTATIARADQIDCPGLGAVFGDWQPAMPALTPSLRKRLVRHIDICRICAQGREGLSLSPELLSAVPMAGPAAAAAQQISSAYDPALGTYRRQRAVSAAARTAAGMAAVGAAGTGVAAAELVPARPRAAAGRPRAGIEAQDDWGDLTADLPGPSHGHGLKIVRKVPLISVAVLVVLVLVAGIGAAAYLQARHDLNSIRRLGNPFASIPARLRAPLPTGPAAKDLTFLVVGVGTRSAAAGNSASGIADALMLVHLIAGGKGAYVVSIPRDSWVPIPAHHKGKAGSAYALGGAALTIRTVEHLTNVRIDHFAIIDWTGFRGVTDALGGVTVNIPVTTHDPGSPVTWTAGRHHLDGAQALLYVRGWGSAASADISDEARQQNYLRAMFQQARRAATLANPLRAVSVLNALPGAVSLDNTLSDSQLLHLADSLRGMSMSQVVFATAPSLGTGSAAGQSIVRLNKSVGQGFWHAFEYDSLPAFMQQHGLHQLGAASH